jgi:hypothetical protein
MLKEVPFKYYQASAALPSSGQCSVVCGPSLFRTQQTKDNRQQTSEDE